MKPSARVQAVIDILEGLNNTPQPVDRYLRDWAKAHRYAGSKDRAAISERIFAILRHRASFAWRMRSESPRSLAIASLLKEGFDEPALENIFSGEGYGAANLTEEERTYILLPPENPPRHVQGEFPQFLDSELSEIFGANLLPEMSALTERAPVDLRVNTLKTLPADVLAQLRADGYDASPTPYSPLGIRIPAGAGSAALSKSPALENGLFDFQDEAAQIASLLCAARPGLRVLDLAAGAGGKSLALAAEMNNIGEIAACDIRRDALDQLATRATRAGATIIHPQLAEDLGQNSFDLVLVDAPCSGSGTWRRQPELKWRLTPARIAEFIEIQDQLLAQAAKLVRPGGRLVYATCSLLQTENEHRIAALLSREPDLKPLCAAAIWREATATNPPPGMGEFFRASPYLTGTDGFFAAILMRAG
ncbi:MAG TPA: RsmB/NOP family class I SAM-dependent RNA methyltransferase [Rhizomicrobium sp.]|nr:RsmB/NOP family class I SAM-dependent RNA methyltransferase [Rhizomicrobium sp.]